MRPWTDMDALCEALLKTESREEALRAIREAPPATAPWWEQDETPPAVDLSVVDLPVAPANDPEVA